MAVVTTSDFSVVEKFVTSRRPRTVAIDGMAGSGKTFLAARIARLLGARHVELDEFLEANQGGFLEYLRYEALKSTIDDASAGPCLIVEGVCLRAVLDRVVFVPDMHVYIKLMIAGAGWVDGSILERTDNLDQALALEQAEAERYARLSDRPLEPGEDSVAGLRRELLAYHFQYLPHLHADLVFERSYQFLA